jgi:hypothetical protein
MRRIAERAALPRGASSGAGLKATKGRNMPPNTISESNTPLSSKIAFGAGSGCPSIISTRLFMEAHHRGTIVAGHRGIPNWFRGYSRCARTANGLLLKYHQRGRLNDLLSGAFLRSCLRSQYRVGGSPPRSACQHICLEFPHCRCGITKSRHNNRPPFNRATLGVRGRMKIPQSSTWPEFTRRSQLHYPSWSSFISPS